MSLARAAVADPADASTSLLRGAVTRAPLAHDPTLVAIRRAPPMSPEDAQRYHRLDAEATDDPGTWTPASDFLARHFPSK